MNIGYFNTFGGIAHIVLNHMYKFFERIPKCAITYDYSLAYSLHDCLALLLGQPIPRDLEDKINAQDDSN